MTQQFIALPEFAPLPVPMVLHALRLSEAVFFEQALHAPEPLRERLRVLRTSLEVAFAYIYPRMMAEIARRNKAQVSLGWFQEQVAEQINQKPSLSGSSEKVYSVSPRTTLTWRIDHLLLPPDSRQVNLDRAAAIFAMAMVDGRRQGFLPPGINPGEPHMWCYAKTGPDAPIVPCPLPLPPRIRPGTLLFMRWPTFEKRWTVLPSIPAPDLAVKTLPTLGAMRFASLTRQTLQHWDDRFSSPEEELLYGPLSQRDVLQAASESLFYRLAPQLLSPSQFPPQLPLVFERQEWIDSLT